MRSKLLAMRRTRLEEIHILL